MLLHRRIFQGNNGHSPMSLVRPKPHSSLPTALGTARLTSCQGLNLHSPRSIPSPWLKPKPWRTTWRSTLPAFVVFFFVEKKDGGLRPCIDYQGLNAMRIKYPHPFLLISLAIEATIFTFYIFTILCASEKATSRRRLTAPCWDTMNTR